MKTRLLAVCSFISILGLAACSSSSGGGDSSSVGPSPSQRWPDKGSFAYKADDGEGCIADKSFDNKADYCVALTDDKANNNCALASRKSLYASDCGTDFQERNIQGGLQSFGWDERLQRSCDTAKPPDLSPTLNDYCKFLSNESVQNNCHWDARKEAFTDNGCPGNFSPEPAAVAKTDPAPNPQPGPQPKPQPQPDQPQFVKDLSAAGIKTNIMRDGEPNLPGKVPFELQLNNFYTQMLPVESEFLSRASTIHSIEFSQYTAFNTSDGSLTIDIYLAAEDVKGYLKLLDRRLNFEKQTGVSLDLSVEVYDTGEADKLAMLTAELSAFESHKQDLKALNGVIHQIKIGDYSSFWLFENLLNLSTATLSADLSAYIIKIKPIAGFYAFVQEKHITLDNKFDFDKEYPEMKETFQRLDTLKSSLEKLKALDKLDSISLNSGSSQTEYYDSSKEFSPASLGPEAELLVDTVHALVSAFDIGAQLGIPMSLGFNYDIGQPLVQCVQHLNNNLAAIRVKKGLIHGITLWTSDTEWSYNNLYIGAGDTDAKLGEIVRQIQ